MCEAVAEASRPELAVQIDFELRGVCPETHRATVLRVADELLSNALEHGLRARSSGQVMVEVVSGNAELSVCVRDDGCGFDRDFSRDGNGFMMLRQLGRLRVGVAQRPYATQVRLTMRLLPRSRLRKDWIARCDHPVESDNVAGAIGEVAHVGCIGGCCRDRTYDPLIKSLFHRLHPALAQVHVRDQNAVKSSHSRPAH